MNVAVQTQPQTQPQAPVVTPSSSPAIQSLGTPPFQMGIKQDGKRWLNMCVYAKHGIGKTTLFGTAADIPQMRGICYIDAESGDLAISDSPYISPEGRQHLEDNRIRVTEWKQAARVHEFLTAHCKLREKGDPDSIFKMRQYEAWVKNKSVEEIEQPTIYNTVLMDSLSEIEKMNIFALLGVDIDSIPEGNAEEIDSAGWDEYKKNNQMLNVFVRRFRDLPMHFLCVASEIYTQDERKRQHYSPAFTGKLSNQLPGAFDIVGRYTVETFANDTSERRLYVQPVGNFIAKNRRAMFKGDYFKDPTMSSIMKDIGLLK